MIKKNDVVSVVTTVGEFIGKYAEASESCITIHDPRMIVHSQEGMGYAAGLCMSGTPAPNIGHFYNGQVVFMDKTNEQVEKAYREFTSGIIT